MYLCMYTHIYTTYSHLRLYTCLYARVSLLVLTSINISIVARITTSVLTRISEFACRSLFEFALVPDVDIYIYTTCLFVSILTCLFLLARVAVFRFVRVCIYVLCTSKSTNVLAIVHVCMHTYIYIHMLVRFSNLRVLFSSHFYIGFYTCVCTAACVRTGVHAYTHVCADICLYLHLPPHRAPLPVYICIYGDKSADFCRFLFVSTCVKLFSYYSNITLVSRNLRVCKFLYTSL